MKLRKLINILSLVIFFITFSNSGCSGCASKTKDVLVQFIYSVLKGWNDDCGDKIQHNPLCPKPPRSSIPCLCQIQPCTQIFINAQLTGFTCTPGMKRGFRQYDSQGNEIPGAVNYDWITLDPYDGEANSCGVAYSDYPGGSKEIYESPCTNGRRSVQGSRYLQGYDLLENAPAVGVKTIKPMNHQVIHESQSITVYFENTVKSDNINFSGSLSSNVDQNFKFSRSSEFNDTLSIKPNGKWNLGSSRSLNINLTDINDKPVSVSLIYHVIKNGTSPTPSFNTCVSPFTCKLSWLSAYSINFEAKGGFPPYQWNALNEIPIGLPFPLPSGFGPGLPPGAIMGSNGILSGPATNNFYGTYYFGVIVTDSIGQSFTSVVTIDTTDLVAQFAACYFLGFCL